MVIAIISHQVIRDIFRPLYFKSWSLTIWSWDGEKLYPPNANALSKVWKLGGLRKVNGILVKTHRQESLIHSDFIIN